MKTELRAQTEDAQLERIRKINESHVARQREKDELEIQLMKQQALDLLTP
jgi:hypothetical protein